MFGEPTTAEARRKGHFCLQTQIEPRWPTRLLGLQILDLESSETRSFLERRSPCAAIVLVGAP